MELTTALLLLEQREIMNKIDLIIDALELAIETSEFERVNSAYRQALAAARELRELKPIAVKNKAASKFMEFSSIESYESGIPSSATLLYALDEVKHGN